MRCFLIPTILFGKKIGQPKAQHRGFVKKRFKIIVKSKRENPCGLFPSNKNGLIKQRGDKHYGSDSKCENEKKEKK